MRSIMKRCPVCGTYTMKDECPKCGERTLSSLPPRFSPEDRYGKYRRALKRMDGD